MKKFKLSFVVIGVLCLTLLSGCFKADTISLLENIVKYKNSIGVYAKQSQEDIGAGIVYVNGTFSLMTSSNVGGLNFYNEIYSTSETKAMYQFLQEGRQYDVILQGASQFFLTKLNSDILTINAGSAATVPQEKNTQLYHKSENVIAQIKQFSVLRTNMEFNFSQADFNSISNSSIRTLDKFLNQFQNLIGAVLEMNMLGQDIFTNYIFPRAVDDITDTLKGLDILRLFDSYEVFITNYLYQKYMVFIEDPKFNFEDDEVYVALNTVRDNYHSSTIGTGETTDETQIEYYKYLKTLESNLKDEAEVNGALVAKLNHKVPTLGTPLQQSYENLYNYSATCMNYLNMLNKLLTGSFLD